MSQYRELLKRLEELDRRIDEAKRNEYESALAEVKATVVAFGFSPAEVFGPSHIKAAGTRRRRKTGSEAAPKKYRDTNPRQTQIEFDA
jgi:DNA-binding protein H-NS